MILIYANNANGYELVKTVRRDITLNVLNNSNNNLNRNR